MADPAASTDFLKCKNIDPKPVDMSSGADILSGDEEQVFSPSLLSYYGRPRLLVEHPVRSMSYSNQMNNYNCSQVRPRKVVAVAGFASSHFSFVDI